MSARYRVLLEAQRELVEAADYYDAEQPGLGTNFVLDYEAAVSRMLGFPETGAPLVRMRLPQPVRRFPFDRFKYALYVAQFPDELIVIAVAHQHRRPGYWRKRLAKVTR